MHSKTAGFINILIFGGFSLVSLSALLTEGTSPQTVGRVAALLVIAAFGFWLTSSRGLSRGWGIGSFVIGWAGMPAVGLLALLFATLFKRRRHAPEGTSKKGVAEAARPAPADDAGKAGFTGSERGSCSMALLSEVMQKFEEGRAQFGVPFVSPYGEQAIPILAETDQGKRGIYVDAGPWDKDSENKFLRWMALLRTSDQEDLDVEIRSEHQAPERLTIYSRREPRVVLELVGLLQVRWSNDPSFGRHNAQLLRRLVWEYLELELPEDIAGLEALDKLVVERLRHEGKGHILPSTILLLGSFFGETLISLCGGRWNVEGVKAEQTTVEVSRGEQVMQANVFGKVMKLFDHGMEDSTAQMARSIEDLQA